ncbi:MAG: MobA/MobL family protein [Oscillospiraceae bacterium]|nr:MobA/MobL family protein [Oscillospiraceae bacterium]
MSIKTIGRGSGRSSVAAAAYRAAEKIYDHRTGLTFDFEKKGGVVHSEILLPEHAPEHYQDRAILWNSVEHAEKQKNARTAREVEIALPAELDREEHVKLAREYVGQFVNRGMCADLNIHDKGDGNPHAHILLTTRPMNPDGTWAAKAAKEYILDRQGQRVMLPSGEWKSRKVPTVDWDKGENAELWREAWAKIVNRELERHGLEPVDHRSFQRQGLDLEPTQHLGPTASQMEKEGRPSYLGDQNREIEARNARREHGRHVRNLDERNYTQREQSRGRERGR